MNGGLPGFHNAPASMAVVVAAALFSLPFGFRGRFHDLGLSYQSVYKKLSIWRLITSLFAFSSTPELIFGVALLYYFMVFERQIGSNKYSVFNIFSIMVSIVLQIIALGYLKASFLIWKTICCTWTFWHTGWAFVSIEYIWHSKVKVPRVCNIAFLTIIMALFQQFLPRITDHGK